MSAPKLTVLLDGEPRASQQARLGAALARRGHRVILWNAPEVVRQIREQHGASCEELRCPRALVPPPLLRWWARGRVRALGVDLVHINYVRQTHDLWSRMEGGPPYVATAWGSDLNDEVFPKKPAHARRIDHVLQHAAALTADSVPLLEKAVRRSANGSIRPPIPSRLVLWGVDLASFTPALAAATAEEWRRRLDIAPGCPVVLSPRQPRPHYHVDRILQAFAASRWAREGVCVIKLHGRAEDAADQPRLTAVARSLGIEPRVRFAPGCAYADLPGLYALADVAVSAVEADGFPSTFCELLALGVPLIATDLPDYQTLLEHGERALLVPPGDVAAMTRALDRLADEPALAAHLRAEGAAWARATADFSACVDAFEAMYRAAIEGAAHRRPAS